MNPYMRAAKIMEGVGVGEMRVMIVYVIGGRQRMKCSLASLVLLLVCLGAMCACDIPFSGGSDAFSASSTTSAPTTPLSGASWSLTRLVIAGRDLALAPTAPITLQFQQDENTYMGSSGCNYYNGAYAVSGNQLHLHFGVVTQRACAGPIMSQEVTYLNEMNQVRTFRMAAESLTLIDDANRIVLLYTAAR